MEYEGRDMIKYLSNKARILMLSIGDVTSAKIEQSNIKRKAIQVEEVHDDGATTELEAGTDHDSSAWGFKNFFGSRTESEQEPEPEQEDTAETLPMSDGEEDMQAADETIPSDIEPEASCDNTSR